MSERNGSTIPSVANSAKPPKTISAIRSASCKRRRRDRWLQSCCKAPIVDPPLWTEPLAFTEPSALRYRRGKLVDITNRQRYGISLLIVSIAYSPESARVVAVDAAAGLHDPIKRWPCC